MDESDRKNHPNTAFHKLHLGDNMNLMLDIIFASSRGAGFLHTLQCRLLGIQKTRGQNDPLI